MSSHRHSHQCATRTRRNKADRCQHYLLPTTTTKATTTTTTTTKTKTTTTTRVFSHHLVVLLVVLGVWVQYGDIVDCQVANRPTVDRTTTIATTVLTPNDNNNVAATTPTATTTTPTYDDLNSTAILNESNILLSRDEFVDYTEAPLLLFDGLTSATNETKELTNDTIVATSSGGDSENRSVNDASTPTPSPETIETTTTTNLKLPPTHETTSNDNDNNNTATTSSGEENEDETDGDAADDDEDKKLSFEPPQNVSQYMDYIETLFHDLRHLITDLFEPHIPQLIRTSQMVQLSGACSYDMLRMALALRQFEPWALRMIDSSGKVPEGIFEGSFTALGSYDECLNTVFASSSSSSAQQQQQSSSATNSNPNPNPNSSLSPSEMRANSNNNQQHHQGATQGKYCLVNVAPFLPPKPPADKVERMFQEEANRRNYTKDDQFTRLSPMFYYMKFRIGVCIPSTCDQNDMESIATALSSSLRLNITIPVNCRVKQAHTPLAGHQLVGGLIVGLVLLLVLGSTLIDWLRKKWKLINEQEIKLIRRVTTHHNHGEPVGERGSSKNRLEFRGEKKLASSNHRPTLEAIIYGKSSFVGGNQSSINNPHSSWEKQDDDHEHDDYSSPIIATNKNNFQQRLAKHWVWMSFSLLTNFRLYFNQRCLTTTPTTTTTTSGCKGYCTGSLKCNQQQQQAQMNNRNHNGTRQRIVLKCLNGIRVLSLCWVIVANSYITLDPRATKRLAKTREAPRDFLFQLVVQASLAIETFFFLSGVLMSLNFAQQLQSSDSSSSSSSSSGATTTTTTTTTSSSFNSKDNTNSNKKNMHTTTPPPVNCPPGQHQLAFKRMRLTLIRWLRFYVHRYIRMTPATMLVIALSMYAYRFGDGPLWFETTQKAHHNCGKNWWRHLLHVANFIDTRQMCFIHYWYIAADMQLFLFAPLLMWLLYKYRTLGLSLMALIGSASIGFVFYTTYTRHLPPTLLFYNSDPESRREFGNVIMTKPLTHAPPYMVGMLVGYWLSCKLLKDQNNNSGNTSPTKQQQHQPTGANHCKLAARQAVIRANCAGTMGGSGTNYGKLSLASLLGSLATLVGLVEVFLPYKWNNSHLPSRFMAALYAALFRLGWSLVLAYVVVSCRHKRGPECHLEAQRPPPPAPPMTPTHTCCVDQDRRLGASSSSLFKNRVGHGDDCDHGGANDVDRTTSGMYASARGTTTTTTPTMGAPGGQQVGPATISSCYCGSGGSLVNRLLSLDIFTHLSKLAFVAYLIHLPMMSVFVSQTRGLFAFSHTLVIHLAISYLVTTFVLSFILVHIIEFPFITFERYLFNCLLDKQHCASNGSAGGGGGCGCCSGSSGYGRGQSPTQTGGNVCVVVVVGESGNSENNLQAPADRQTERNLASAIDGERGGGVGPESMLDELDQKSNLVATRMDHSRHKILAAIEARNRRCQQAASVNEEQHLEGGQFRVSERL